MTADIWAPARVRGRPRNLFVPGALNPVDLRLVTGLLQILAKQSLFRTSLSHLLGRGTSWQGAISVKT